jgi:hypothetical protein
MFQRNLFFCILFTAQFLVGKAQINRDSTKTRINIREYSGVYASIAVGGAYQPNDARVMLWPTDSIPRVYPVNFGFRMQAQIEATIKNGVGFALRAARQTFACDNAPIVQVYQKVLPRYNWSAVGNSYLFRTISFGLNYVYNPVPDQKVKANFKLMLGGGNVTTPVVSMMGRHNDSTVMVRIDSRTAKLVTVVLGIGLRYEVTETINLSVETEFQYYNLNGSIAGIDAYSGGLNRVKLPAEKFPLDFVAMNINFGIGFNFR